jgi:hypothetical protein
MRVYTDKTVLETKLNIRIILMKIPCYCQTPFFPSKKKKEENLKHLISEMISCMFKKYQKNLKIFVEGPLCYSNT